jgi:hypothetical protein
MTRNKNYKNYLKSSPKVTSKNAIKNYITDQKSKKSRVNMKKSLKLFIKIKNN